MQSIVLGDVAWGIRYRLPGHGSLSNPIALTALLTMATGIITNCNSKTMNTGSNHRVLDQQANHDYPKSFDLLPSYDETKMTDSSAS